MGKKSKPKEPVKEPQEPTEATDATEPQTQPAFTPGLVRVRNKTAQELDITLTDGKNLRVGPKKKGSTQNVSRPVLRKLLPVKPINKLVSRGHIEVEPGANTEEA